MQKIKTLVVLFGLSLILNSIVFAEVGKTTLFNFEKTNDGWGIPEWAMQKPEYVGQKAESSNKYASKGKSSLELMANFPGGLWTAVYVEIVDNYDWEPYSSVFVDLYIPESAPTGLRARLVLTVSDDWTWVESMRPVTLIPGKWVTLSANLKAGSKDWKAEEITDEFRRDIRKIGVRVESNMRPAYQGPIYIDNLRLK